MKLALSKSQFFKLFDFPSQQNYLIHLIVCLHLAITLPLAAILNIWTDEAYSLDTTSQNIQYAISQGINYEIQPPLYFVLLNIWRSVNSSIFWGRLFSIICIALTIYLVALLSQKFIKTINPLWIVACFAFNPFTIKLALEIRVYAWAMLLSALLLWFFFDGYLESNSKTKTKARISYFFLGIIALYSQYYLACLLMGNAIVLLLLRRWQALKSYILSMSLVTLIFSPLAFFILKQISTHTNNLEQNFWQNFITIQQSKMRGFLGNFANLPPAVLIIGFILILALILGLIFTIDLLQINRNHVAIWTNNLTAIAFFSGILIITNGLLLFRHTVGIFIIFCLGFFLILSLIKYPKIKNTITIFITVVALLFYAQNLYKNYSILAKAGDWKRVATYIMNNEQPQQEILVFPSIAAEELSYYYQGINQIIPLPQPEDFKNYDLQNYALNNEAEITEALASDLHDLWLVERVNRTCITFGVNWNCEILENFINKSYQVTDSQKFYKSKIRFLEHQ